MNELRRETRLENDKRQCNFIKLFINLLLNFNLSYNIKPFKPQHLILYKHHIRRLINTKQTTS
jgi:hypothetical protein